MDARRALRDAAVVTFDPGAAVAQLGKELVKFGRRDPAGYFLGRWEERHPLNAPGPFYGAMTDTCCDGPLFAPASLFYDHDGAGYVWRQPRDEPETLALMAGAYSDPFSGYACDGDQHWTPDLVRQWWQERPSTNTSCSSPSLLAMTPRGHPPTVEDESWSAR